MSNSNITQYKNIIKIYKRVWWLHIFWTKGDLTYKEKDEDEVEEEVMDDISIG